MRKLFALILLAGCSAWAQMPAAITDPQQIISPRRDDLRTLPLERLLMTRGIGGSTWSPDGAQIAFVANISGRENLWLVPSEGGWPTQLTVSDQRQRNPVWSPSGKFIAFVSDHDGNEQWDVFIVASASGEVTNLTNSPAISEDDPAWSPDSRYLAWTAKSETGSGEIEVFDMLLRRRRALTQNTAKGVGNFHPLWSKDGKWIAYTQGRSDGKDSNVWIVEVATGKSTNLTPHQDAQRYSASDWSPDGKQLLITSTALNGYLNVALLQIATGKLDWLTTEKQDGRAGTFSPDGKVITFTSTAGGTTEIFLYHKDSNKAETLPTKKSSEGALSFADFGVATLDGPSAFSRDGSRLLFYFEAADASKELWVYALATRQSQQLTHSLMAGVRNQDLVTPSLVAYAGHDAKSRVSAFVSVPYNQIKNGQVPAIVYLRDAEHNPFPTGFSPTLQFLLNQGYFVIAPDITSAGLDADDVVAAAGWIRQNGYIDPRKLVVMGEGYGGSLALTAMAKAPQTWAAAIVLGPALDVSTGPSFPANFAAAVKAPMLLAAGANDPHALAAAVQQLADTIRKSGGKVELKIYGNEGRALARVENRIDVWQRISAFLKFHVPAPGCGCSLE